GPRLKLALLAGVGLLVALKALAGYEYITTVILAPVAAAWFHQHRAGEPLRKRLAFAAGLVSVGLAGFAAALVLHVAQVRAVLNEDGVAVIRERAVTRTAGALGADSVEDRRPGEAGPAYAQ